MYIKTNIQFPNIEVFGPGFTRNASLNVCFRFVVGPEFALNEIRRTKRRGKCVKMEIWTFVISEQPRTGWRVAQEPN